MRQRKNKRKRSEALKEASLKKITDLQGKLNRSMTIGIRNKRKNSCMTKRSVNFRQPISSRLMT